MPAKHPRIGASFIYRARSAECEFGGPGEEDSTWKCYTIGALVIRIGFWGILYSNYNKEPPESIGTSSQSR